MYCIFNRIAKAKTPKVLIRMVQFQPKFQTYQKRFVELTQLVYELSFSGVRPTALTWPLSSSKIVHNSFLFKKFSYLL